MHEHAERGSPHTELQGAGNTALISRRRSIGCASCWNFQDVDGNARFSDTVKSDVISETVFVFTPAGGDRLLPVPRRLTLPMPFTPSWGIAAVAQRSWGDGAAGL